MAEATDTRSSRIESLDQFRGYTMWGMFLVNFIGGYAVIPSIFTHNNTYCSYADTIMPHFFFAVGFTLRLAFLRRAERGDLRSAYKHAVKRCLGLVLIGIVLYHLDGHYKTWATLRELGLKGFLAENFRARMWQALVHIGVTSLWVLPVITTRARVRIAFMAASAGLQLALSHWFYYDWVIANKSIDGGPLGFMTWSIPTIVGSLAHDAMLNRGARRALRPLLVWGVALMALGYGFSCIGAINRALAGANGGGGIGAWLAAPPFVPPVGKADFWAMNQRVGSISYLTFAAGLSLMVYAVFVAACDIGSFRLGMWRTFGTNALAGYVLHDLVAGAFIPFTPGDAPFWYVMTMLVAFMAITYLFLRFLEKNRIYLKL